MNYSTKATSQAHGEANIEVRSARIPFGIVPAHEEEPPNPAELFLSALAACILKNVERFSSILKYSYEGAEVTITAIRQDNPPRMDRIHYELTIVSNDPKLNIGLLKKNIEKFGTIYNTIRAATEITGEILKVESHV